MDWTRAIDGYCERTDASLWSEPLNAATNAAFLIAAIITWRRSRGLPLARLLALILAAIGVGSALFHTLANAWSALADTPPILTFIMTYVYVASRGFLGLPAWAAALSAAAFVPYAALLGAAFAALPFFAISAAYWPVAVLIALYALLLRRRAPRTARGLALGAALLATSLAFRSLDAPLCDAIPLGTHWIWHCLNGLLLGWMIEVYRRHMVALGPARR